MDEINVVVPYGWVKESMNRANKKYRESNRERYNEKQKKFYDAHKDDEEYKQKMRTKALAYYYRKKAEKAAAYAAADTATASVL